MHGVEFVDPYRWLEDQESDETRAWIAQQDAYAHVTLDDLPIRSRLHERLEALSRVDEIGTPWQREDRFFIEKKAASDELWTLYVRRGLRGDDEVLIDPHTLSDDHSISAALLGASSDGRYVVYGLRSGGEDETDIRVMDVDTRSDLPDRLPRDRYTGVAWLKQTYDGFYYGRHDLDTGPRIRFHRLGSDAAEDAIVFGEGCGPSTWLFPYVSDDGRYLYISLSEGWQRSEIFIQDLAEGGEIRSIVSGIDANFTGDFAGSKLVVRTDYMAPKYRICLVDLDAPLGPPDTWPEIVPEGDDPIEDFTLAGDKLFVRTLHDVASVVRVYTLDGERCGEIPLPAFGTAFGPWGQWGRDDAFTLVTTWTQPNEYFHYSVASERLETWSKSGVPFDGLEFVVEQVWYASKDGTQIPMTIAHRKGLELDGDRPTLLYGYGGFGVSMTPMFWCGWAAWMELGGVFAVPNLRGGGEFGEEWHRAGMLENKQNVFDDFIAGAEWLIDNGYTNPSRLGIQGASNGGVLVGAALTQRPDLFQAALCLVPDLDMLGMPRFVLNPPALLEYGDATKPEHFEFLRRYSPYQKVADGVDYPAVLLRTGDADTRVAPLQARKMTARLQAATSSRRPVFLLYEEKTGHAGDEPTRKVIDDRALELAFLAWQLGVEQ